jgi:hypothetical protein
MFALDANPGSNGSACAPNRTGLLCGRCENGLSETVGGQAGCQVCSEADPIPWIVSLLVALLYTGYVVAHSVEKETTVVSMLIFVQLPQFYQLTSVIDVPVLPYPELLVDHD